ncbi:acyltransferase family protein [Nocardioides jiangxiensis]|uniref:Acyltransferase n=1 Tax=Nocardioides jiangxiensis TaxID=3064524 RepID=A0ABT9AYZ6_9ACTN|nr:acyltransferase [Nocardioides sp. WY-20]MDO7867807.1 acyltransferase [Nocardioides sp. WY-20]
MADHRVDGIEGVRGIAALSVMGGHVLLFMLGGAFAGSALLGPLAVVLLNGVTLFFVLSGYLLYRPFVSAVVDARPSPRVTTFYRNRLLRIFPAYLVVFAASAFVLGVAVVQTTDPAAPTRIEERLGYLTDPVLVLLNLTLTQGYVPRGNLTGINVSWSLVPELAFYAVLPVLYLIGRALSRGRRSPLAMAAPAVLLLVVGAVGRLTARSMLLADGPEHVEGRLDGSTWAGVLTHSFLGVCDLFAIGMLVAVAAAACQRTSHRRGVALLRLAVGAGVLVAALSTFALRPLLLDPPAWAATFAGLLFLVVAPGGGRLRRLAVAVLDSRPLTHLGVISYSVYLWQMPVLLMLLKHWPDAKFHSAGGLLLAAAMVLVPTLLLSELSYRFVEKPALDRKRPMVAVSGPVVSVPAQRTTERAPAAEDVRV